jgi:hypothetical protein
MKRFLTVLAVAAVAGAMYVAAAPGGRTVAPTRKQFNALKKQVTQLGKKVKSQGSTIATLQSNLTALQTDESSVKTAADDADGFISTCLAAAGVVPVGQFGDGTGGTYGYSYMDGSGVTGFTTALDVDGSSTPGAYVQAVAPSCITSGALHKTGAPAEHRASGLAAAKP